jgi:hypothetical protein
MLNEAKKPGPKRDEPSFKTLIGSFSILKYKHYALTFDPKSCESFDPYYIY